MQLAIGKILYLNLKPAHITIKFNIEFLSNIFKRPRLIKMIEPGVYEEIEPPQYEHFYKL